MTRHLKIGLLWHTLGHANLGVDALAQGNSSLIRGAAKSLGIEVQFVTLGFGQNSMVSNLPADVVVGPSPSVRQLLTGRSQFLKVIRDCDIVFDIGEGDSFTDIYGWRRYSFYLGTKIAVMTMGKPLVLSPQTIGPFNNGIRRLLARSVMRRAKAVYARDALSSAFLNEIGVRDNVNEFIDVAFALPYEAQQKADDRLRVGFNVSGLLYNEGYTGKNELGMKLNYKKLTDELIETLLARDGVEVHLISHVIGTDGPDTDVPACQALAQRFPAAVLAPVFKSAEEVKGYISGMDFVIAGRMHACIGAFSAGIPVVPIAYSRKFNGLFGTLDYPYFIDGKAVDGESAKRAVLEHFDNRDVLEAAVIAGRSKAVALLERYSEALKSLLHSASDNER